MEGSVSVSTTRFNISIIVFVDEQHNLKSNYVWAYMWFREDKYMRIHAYRINQWHIAGSAMLKPDRVICVEDSVVIWLSTGAYSANKNILASARTQKTFKGEFGGTLDIFFTTAGAFMNAEDICATWQKPCGSDWAECNDTFISELLPKPEMKDVLIICIYPTAVHSGSSRVWLSLNLWVCLRMTRWCCLTPLLSSSLMDSIWFWFLNEPTTLGHKYDIL